MGLYEVNKISRWQHLQVISQAVYSVHHVLPCGRHAAEKTDRQATISQQFSFAILGICASELTHVRLPPSASTPRQILKADAPLVV